MRTPLLKLNAVAKSFGAVRALREVSFELHAGEVHALLGENGAGKSTLIKVIAGAHPPDAGALEIDGVPHTRLTPAAAHKLGVACVYQQPALFADLTVAENVALRLDQPRVFKTIRWRAQQERAEKLLQRIGAKISPEREVRELSMPEQQIVEIACAIGTGARILILDEPTASLTQTEQHRLFAIVRDLKKSGVGIIYISHRLEEIFALADRVTVLRDGQSVLTRNVADITERDLIAAMVGREISQIYPPRGTSAGEVTLEVRNLMGGISFHVRAGEVVGMAGLVGAGRTELARTIFGITPAEDGEILLNGNRVTIGSPGHAVAAGIAYVPEDRRRHGVVLELPIAFNISMATLRELWLRPRSERQLALEYIRDLAIKASGPEAPGSSLSGGNQQKVALARWLATKPRVLILDEPTQGVDIGAKSEIHKLIRKLADDGLAVLMISSDLPEILGMSDRVLVMRHGKIAAELPRGSDATAIMAAALGKGAP